MMIERKDMIEFIKTVKEKLGTESIPQGTFWAEVRERNKSVGSRDAWYKKEVVSCLRYLGKNGYIKITDNWAIKLVRE